MKIKKIVIITNMMSYYRIDLFNELSYNKNYDFHVIFSAEKEDNKRNWEIDKTKIKFEYTILDSRSIVKKSKGIKETRIINLPKNVFKTLNMIKPDIIIGSEYNPTIIKAFIFCKICGTKFISWSDGTLNSERFISLPQKILRKIICKNSDFFIASSNETKSAQIRYGAHRDKISISLLTINVDKFREDLSKSDKEHNDIPVILFCGYLIKLKGIDLLLKALSSVKSEFRLNIIGSGEEESNLKKLADELQINDKVDFCGYKSRSAIGGFYRNADIFVFPSLNDAFGLVLVEAITAGLPVITSLYAGGSKDVVENGVNGYIIDPENFDDFSNKMELLLGDEELRQTMGIKSLEKSGNFSLKNVVIGFYKAVENCLKGK